MEGEREEEGGETHFLKYDFVQNFMEGAINALFSSCAVVVTLWRRDRREKNVAIKKRRGKGRDGGGGEKNFFDKFCFTFLLFLYLCMWMKLCL